MKYELQTWHIRRLIEVFDAERLILDPPYQRNAIWSLKSQKMLVQTITSEQPIPNFFLLAKKNGTFEMVDGQQRARTIIGYMRGDFTDFNGLMYEQLDNAEKERLLNYSLSITVISNIEETESIEAFYALVNSSGLRLNRPELKKAEYFKTNFLRLITTLAEHPDFLDLRLFPIGSVNRMNNVDFVSELIALIVFGFSDKKEKVDELFEHDISDKQYQQLKNKFLAIMQHFKRFDSIYPVNRTRFRQKNDFYSLFAFILMTPQLNEDNLDYFYRLLLKLAPYIRPSQEECDPLMDYALNCVTQSNSKHAREARHHVLVNLLLNETTKPNDIQRQIMAFFRMNDAHLVSISSYATLSLAAIHDPFQAELPLGEA